MFQSTRPHGARQQRKAAMPRQRVSIHAPARGATLLDIELRSDCICVSIHAPARGATASQTAISVMMSVSIHAPARGATWPQSRESRRSSRFNPRARMGRDCLPMTSHGKMDAEFQSTRPHGARQVVLHDISRSWDLRFNPRARMGRDVSLRIALIRSSTFQSTRPHGARPIASGVMRIWWI